MKTENIQNRIDSNILSLLENQSLSECQDHLFRIQNNLKSRVISECESINEALKIETARERYTWIYILHTKKRIKDLSTMNYKREFKKLLFKERLQNEQKIPINYSSKYRLIAITES